MQEKKYEYEYIIYTEADADIFKQQCIALEENIPTIVEKGSLLVDVDGTETRIYTLQGGGEIEVRNDYYVGYVGVRSTGALEKYLKNVEM